MLQKGLGFGVEQAYICYTEQSLEAMMKTQLLMIITLITSSLLTLSQRASAEEISQLRWLEPNIEQGLCDLAIPDQDQELDQGALSSPDKIEISTQSISLVSLYVSPTRSLKTDQIYPRAPPVSLI